MAHFSFPKFKDYGFPDDEDDQVLISRREAMRVRIMLRKAGHLAHVESNPKADEYRVWMQHPKMKNWCAYMHRSDFVSLMKGEEPYWIAK